MYQQTIVCTDCCTNKPSTEHQQSTNTIQHRASRMPKTERRTAFRVLFSCLNATRDGRKG
uniref:Uncharacterized protein n=1 Tax=Siphoviridae sp. ctTDf8 TaxID=2825517 RepID=A0A8S5UJ59_9CAUD|nr:MAG TPA: hypothetical protein [Siphoviridae sp. ctTDf8]DAR00832.1 MAG TPA: hypothetical protein [Caudoviricetes sp.]